MQSIIAIALALTALVACEADGDDPTSMPPPADEAAAPGCEDLVALHAIEGWSFTDEIQPDICDAGGCRSVDADRFFHFVAADAGFYRLSVTEGARLVPMGDCDAPRDRALTSDYVSPVLELERWLAAGQVYVVGVTGLAHDSGVDEVPDSITFTVQAEHLAEVESPRELPTCEDWPDIPAAGDENTWQVEDSIVPAECDIGCSDGGPDQFLFVAPEAGEYQLIIEGTDQEAGAPWLKVLDVCQAAVTGAQTETVVLAAGEMVALHVYREDYIGDWVPQVPYRLRIEGRASRE
jgi:hypothetical protein